MGSRNHLLACVLLAFLGTGCASTINASIGHRKVIARSDYFKPIGMSYPSTGYDGKEFNVYFLNDKWVRLTATQIRWEHYSLPLPSTWSEIRLNEVGDAVNVIVDGVKWITIYPAA